MPFGVLPLVAQTIGNPSQPSCKKIKKSRRVTWEKLRGSTRLRTKECQTRVKVNRNESIIQVHRKLHIVIQEVHFQDYIEGLRSAGKSKTYYNRLKTWIFFKGLKNSAGWSLDMVFTTVDYNWHLLKIIKNFFISSCYRKLQNSPCVEIQSTQFSFIPWSATP